MDKRISLFLLGSAAVHAAALGLINVDVGKQPLPGAPMQVSIQATKASPATPPDSPAKPSVARQAAITADPPAPARVPKPRKPVSTANQAVLSIDTTTVPTETVVPLAAKRPAPSLDTSIDNHSVAKPTRSAQKQITPPAPQRRQQATTTASLQTAEPVTTTPHTAQTASLLQASLQQAFAVKFHYPRLAQRRGWQGEVQLRLRVQANGQLSNIRVLHSSGHRLLDQAAMATLADVQQLPQATALLHGRSIDLILPVIYRLL